MRRKYRAGSHIRRGEVRPRARLLAYAQRLGLARSDAEDLVQELYVLLPGLLSREEPVRDLFGYLFGCLHGMAATGRARERRRVRLLEQCLLGFYVDPGHEDRLLAYLTVERILDGLPPADAKLLRWRFVEDEPIPEIAERLDTTENAVSIRLHRALRKARDMSGPSG